MRGFIILLMSDALDSEEYIEIIAIINSQLATFINYYKDSNSYLERYLSQLSKQTFSDIVRRIQSQITHAFEVETEGAIENANEAIQVLDCFYKANVKREDKDKINY